VAAEIAAAGGVATVDGTSVADFDGVEAMIRRTVDQHGRLDAVVNNAGILRDRMITGMSEDDFDAVISVHLKGTFNVMRHASEHWRSVAKAGGRPTGRIINTTSGTGLFGNVGQANYGAAKAGIASMTVNAAMELERYGVTVNAISPLAKTRMTEGLGWGADDPDAWDRFDPANASPVVAWLASEASGWLTGAVLRTNGDTVELVRGWEVDPRVQYRSRPGGRLEAESIDRGLRAAFRAGHRRRRLPVRRLRWHHGRKRVRLVPSN
jgi:NAD(P)-dependent dehydrogenase (short-subunit alcohol dehydrogenase family)